MALGQKIFFVETFVERMALMRKVQNEKFFCQKPFLAKLRPNKVPNLDGVAAYKFDARALTSRFSFV